MYIFGGKYGKILGMQMRSVQFWQHSAASRAAGAGRCWRGWTLADGRCFRAFPDDPRSWADARAACPALAFCTEVERPFSPKVFPGLFFLGFSTFLKESERAGHCGVLGYFADPAILHLTVVGYNCSREGSIYDHYWSGINFACCCS